MIAILWRGTALSAALVFSALFTAAAPSAAQDVAVTSNEIETGQSTAATIHPQSITRLGGMTLIADAPVDGAALLSDLIPFRRAVLHDLGLSPDTALPPVTFTILNDTDSFARLIPLPGTAAVYLRSSIGYDIVVGYSSDPEHYLSDALEPGWLRLILRHELVHHIMEAASPRQQPRWLGEGLAEYYASYDHDPVTGEARFGVAALGQSDPSQTDGWLPMRTIVESMSDYPDNQRPIMAETLFRNQQLFYGQSWALTQFLMSRPDGIGAVDQFIDGWAWFEDSEDSFKRATGYDYLTMETALRDAAKSGLPIRPALRADDAASLTPITRRANTMDISRNTARLIDSYAQAYTLLPDTPDERPSNPEGDPAAFALLALRLGDWETGTKRIESAAQAGVDASTLARLRARRAYGRLLDNQMDESRWSEAERQTLAALTLNPEDIDLRLQRVAVHLPEAERLSASARESLDWIVDRKVWLKRPHRTMMVIPALIYEQRFDTAIEILDTAERWDNDFADRMVINRLRSDVQVARMTAE